jgi:hypothetical protein
MGRASISIAGMLGVVLFGAVALAALRSGSDLWTSGVYTTALGVLGFATLGAVLRRGPVRAYWVGFAIFGWGYLALAHGAETRQRLLTTHLLDEIRQLMIRVPRAAGERFMVERQGQYVPATVLEIIPAAIIDIKKDQYKVNFDGWTSYHDEWVDLSRIRTDLPSPPVSLGKPVPVTILPFPNHQVIGHSLFTVVFGVVGGSFGLYFASRREGTTQRIDAESSNPDMA